MASGMARSPRGLGGILDPGQPVAPVLVGTIQSAHVFRHVSGRSYIIQDPGPFFLGSHKGSYGTLTALGQGLADLGGPRRADGRPPPGPGTIGCAGCGVGVPQGRRGLNGTCMRRRRHLPRASGGASAAPGWGGSLSRSTDYGTLEPRSAASAAPRASRTWAARGAPIRHLCIVGTVAPRRGPFGHVRLALSLPWTWCRRWTAPGGLVAPFDPGDRPILKGA